VGGPAISKKGGRGSNDSYPFHYRSQRIDMLGGGITLGEEML